MKKILPVLSTLLLTLSMGPAMADPGRWDNHVGTRARIQISIDNHHVHGRGARHSGLIVSPPVVIDPARVAYFCQTAQQYYPNVPTCNVPWQLVNY